MRLGKLSKVSGLNDLRVILSEQRYEFVVVCGYDNVGKGFIINSLFEDIPVFHPDYSLICNQVSKSGRWSYFMYFLDLYSKLKDSINLTSPLVFDRSSICGSVYNNDYKIAQQYAKKVKDIKALHILVTVDSRESYANLCNVRDNDEEVNYEDYLVFTERYRCYMDAFDIDYVEYVNSYNETMGSYLSTVCGGCSHFKSGKCTSENSGYDNVNFDTERCEYSKERGVQDK